MKIINVKLDEVKIGKRYRTTNKDVIERLKSSIKEIGLLQPIVISKDKDLVAGFHRLQALKELGYEEVPAVVCKEDTEFFCEMEENFVRSELTTLERAELLKTIQDYIYDHGKSREEFFEYAREKFGLSQTQIYNYLLVAKIDPVEKDKLRNKDLSLKQLVRIAKKVKNNKKSDIDDKVKLLQEMLGFKSRKALMEYLVQQALKDLGIE
ncbi:MAG TPA: hypothetical protein ENL38_01800 [Candidatus Aminicenantes bacterium]|nr:hypothetical protein [Candidatus Aminicenantes bacterium]